jgi:hypothetical protein
MRQFGVGMGIPGQLNRLYEGEKHIDSCKVLSAQRMQGKQAFLTPNGFKHSSPLKKSSSAGDYNGSFAKALPHMPDGTHGPRGQRQAIRDIGPKNIYTSPHKKACGSEGATPKICFDEVEYVPSDFDAYDKFERVSLSIHSLDFNHYS